MRGKGLNKLNERFTDVADRVSEGMGDWRTTLFALCCLIGWIAIGPLFHWSDTWQLIANTPTTWAELFIGFLLAAAANRSERHGKRQMERLDRMEREHGAELAAIRQENQQLRAINEGQSEILAVLRQAVVRVDGGVVEEGVKSGDDYTTGLPVLAQPVKGRSKRGRQASGEQVL